ncbi:MAG: hypothetical protein GC186_14055 [Rhodobacteraceae bacterium]|nr:hypothetical protein [Paracoccaceae bacterium]
MQDAPANEDLIRLDPTVRFLKWLVTALTITMIAGLITIVAVFVIRFPTDDDQIPAIPAKITLPAGETPSAVTMGKGWVAIVTDSGKILIFDGRTGVLKHSYALND